MGVISEILAASKEEEETSIIEPQQTPVVKKRTGILSILALPEEQRQELKVKDTTIGDELDVTASKIQKNTMTNSAVQQAALRFVKDRFGMTDINTQDAMDEFIEHFREFNVNELTAAGDYRYVSAAAADATKRGDEKAAQRLSDYRLLYQTFSEMPSFSDGFWKATGDYAEGILKAPSTYVGLALPGAGKAGGIAATQAAKQAVNRTLAQALKTPITTLASKAAANPIKTAVA